MRFSVIIPAHNEAALLPRALGAVEKPAEHLVGQTEVIVINRCTDATALVAEEFGAKVVTCNARNIAAVRNAGSAAANGEIILTP